MQFKINLLGKNITYLSEPSIEYWDQILPSTYLFCDNTEFNESDKILIIGSDKGILSTFISHSLNKGELWLWEDNLIKLKHVEKTLTINLVDNVKFIRQSFLSKKYYRYFDKVLLQQPKSRPLSRRFVLHGYETLKKDGRLFLAGAKKLGVQSSINDTEKLFGNSKILAYKKGNRIAQFEKSDRVCENPVWMKQPGIAPDSWFEFSITLKNNDFRLFSLPGIFSYNRLDEGTLMLLDHLKGIRGKNILDIGCGYGIIGLFALTEGANHVSFLDISQAALDAVTKNLSTQEKWTYAVYGTNDTFEKLDFGFDMILSNPPFHTNKDINLHNSNQIFRKAHHFIHPDGIFLLVSNSFLPYPSMLRNYFKNVDILYDNKKYRVIASYCKK